MIARPPIGFIVEGHSEFNSYPSLVARVVGAHVHVPVVNAGGCGALIRNLDKHLSSLCLAYRPLHVVVTVDLRDSLDQQLARDCESLCRRLLDVAGAWKSSARSDERLQPLPDTVTAVIQIPKFESWMLADVGGLIAAGHLRPGTPEVEQADEFARDPATFLREHLSGDVKLKSAAGAKALISAASPIQMRAHSRSFDKFYREIERLYEDWITRGAIPDA